MKFIDEKGKVFGKISLFDLLVVLFLAGLMPVLYIGNKALSGRIAPKDLKTVQVEVKFTSIVPELANSMHEGDAFKDSDGDTVGVLKRIISNTPAESISITQLNLRANDYLLVPNPGAKDVLCLFQLKCSEDKRFLSFNGYAVKIGSGITLNSDNYDAQGIVTGFDRGNASGNKGK